MNKPGPKCIHGENAKMVPVRLSQRMYRRLKKLSFLTEKPMSTLVRESVEKTLEENKKVLINSDIVIS